MIISIASGKGGTGKTTVAINLALALSDSQSLKFIDCDVEEPNAYFFLKPELSQKIPVSIPVPEINEKKCDFCGKCAEICEYNALAVLKDTVLVFAELCHGCGGCTLLCPKKAITEKDRQIGIMEIGSTGKITFIHGKLNIGEAMSPPLIREVKKQIKPSDTVIIDAPPGTSCPVIEAVKGSDFSLLVTEPTPFGLNDLKLAVETLKQMKIPHGVVLNRAGVGDNKVKNYCNRENIPILMEIPMDRKIAEAYSEGKSIIETMPEYTQKFLTLYKKIINLNYSLKDVT
jgi:MinD superfamily P-loop ATPase